MAINSSNRKHSLGDLRRSTNKTKPRSPDFLGNLHLQRHTFEAIANKFQQSGVYEIICPIAAWGYSDEGGLYLTIQLSPPYQATKKPKPDILRAMFGNDDDEE
jgi:hypothetical protein